MGNDVKTTKEILGEIVDQIGREEAVNILESFYEAFLLMSDEGVQKKGLMYDSYQLKKLLVELLIAAKKEYKFRI